MKAFVCGCMLWNGMEVSKKYVIDLTSLYYYICSALHYTARSTLSIYGDICLAYKGLEAFVRALNVIWRCNIPTCPHWKFDHCDAWSPYRNWLCDLCGSSVNYSILDGYACTHGVYTNAKRNGRGVHEQHIALNPLFLFSPLLVRNYKPGFPKIWTR